MPNEEWLVTCEGYTLATFSDLEEAEDYADMWNAAYPSPSYSKFVVVRVEYA